MNKLNIVPQEVIEGQIFIIRNKKVMIDRDLAKLYEVQTRVLNQAVKRNISRFPEDFIFQLSNHEKNELVTNCDRFNSIKHTTNNPFAFTEQGIAMLSSVLNSERAINVNIEIMRTFIRMRDVVLTNEEIKAKLDQFEQTFEEHDNQLKLIFDTLRNFMVSSSKSRKIGFKP